MSKREIVRAWKDPIYRKSLTAEQQAALPASPVGAIELSDLELGAVSGGLPPHTAPILCNPTSRVSCDCTTNWPRGLPC